MTVAIRLRCTCRRLVGTIDHGSDQALFEPKNVDSGKRRPAGLDDEAFAGWWLIAYVPIKDIVTVRPKCRRCGKRLNFDVDDIKRAQQRSAVTGKPQDLTTT